MSFISQTESRFLHGLKVRNDLASWFRRHLSGCQPPVVPAFVTVMFIHTEWVFLHLSFTDLHDKCQIAFLLLYGTGYSLYNFPHAAILLALISKMSIINA